MIKTREVSAGLWTMSGVSEERQLFFDVNVTAFSMKFAVQKRYLQKTFRALLEQMAFQAIVCVCVFVCINCIWMCWRVCH